MPVEISDGSGTPHATNYSDLLDKLVTFASANGWTVLQNDSTMTVLQGEGAGSDEIIVSFKKYSDTGTDAYGWFLNGYSGYTAGLAFDQQPGALPNWSSTAANAYPALPLWNSTIPYWFIVSGRRIIVVAKISTTYQTACLGFFLPYSSPGEYPYPLMVGGSQYRTSATNYPRFSNATDAASAFWRGRSASPGTLFMRLPDGSWKSVVNTQTEASVVAWTSNAQAGIFPYNSTNKWSVTQLTQALDGTAILTPLQWHTGSKTATQIGWIGELDGIFHISGNSHATEDIVTVGGDDHVVIQDVFRTGVSDYCAVRLT